MEKQQLPHDNPAVDVLRRGSMVLTEMSQILGVFQEPPTAAKEVDDKLVGGLMQLLLDLRREARKAKNFAMADQIRKRLDGTRRDAGRSARRHGLAGGIVAQA